MYTVDLLRGKGLPRKSRPIVVALAMVPLLIPIIGSLALAACWQHNQTLISTQQKIIRDNQTKIDTNAGDFDRYTQISTGILVFNQQLADVSTALKYRIQLTGMLTELTQNLPDNLAMIKFDLIRSDQRKKETDDKTGSIRHVTIIQRKVQITVAGSLAADTDMAADLYIRQLRQSESLKTLVSDIQISARTNGQMDGRSCAFYDIDCTLKDQL